MTARIFRSAGLYFAIVFAAGFVLGTIRTLWIVPRIGMRAAELFETPIMLAVSFFAARWIIRCHSLRVSQRTTVGLLALAFLVAAELVMITLVQRMTISQYIASRDPVSGIAYLVALLVFAAMPVLVARR